MKKYFFIYIFILLLQKNLHSSQKSEDPEYITGTTCAIQCFRGLGDIMSENEAQVYYRSYLPLTISGGGTNKKVDLSTFASPFFLLTDFGQDYCQKNIMPSLQTWHDNTKGDYFIYAVSQGAATYINSDKSKYKKPRAIIFESPLFFANSAISHKKVPSKGYWKKIIPHFAPLIFPNYKPDGKQPLDSNLFHTYKDIPIIIVVHKEDPVVPHENSLALYYAACKERETEENKNVYLIETEENNPTNRSHFGLFKNNTRDKFRIRDIIYTILRKHEIVYHKKKNSETKQYEDFLDHDDKEHYEKIMSKISSNELNPDYQNYKKYYDTYCEWREFDKKYGKKLGYIQKSISLFCDIFFVMTSLYASQKIASLFFKKIRGKPFFVKSIIESLKRRIANSCF